MTQKQIIAIAARRTAPLKVRHGRCLLVLATALLLTACASPYRAPEGKDVARLRIAGPQTKLQTGVNAISYPSGKCENPMRLGYFGGVARWMDERHLGIPGADKLEELTFIERRIPANRRELVTLRSISHTATCVITFSLEPEAGADYEAQMHWDLKKCYVSVHRIRDLEGNVTYSRDATTRQEQTCTKGLG